MPGHNHWVDCGCGWCVKQRTKRSVLRPSGVQPLYDTFQSFLDPNAVCPVCGQAVYFYRSPFGGRVFFDELGPPWPKHGCTDHRNAPLRSAPTSDDAAVEVAPSWRGKAWQPLHIARVYKEDGWWVISAKIAETKVPVRLLTSACPGLRSGALAHFTRWDRSGHAVVSFVNDRSLEILQIDAFQYATFVFTSSEEAVKVRDAVAGSKTP